MPQDIKSFFHEWCAKKKVEPAFEVRPTGEFSRIFSMFFFVGKMPEIYSVYKKSIILQDLYYLFKLNLF